MTIIAIKCGWCGKGMGQKGGQGVTGTSHGICAPCSEKLLADAEAIRACRLVARGYRAMDGWTPLGMDMERVADLAERKPQSHS